MSRLQNSFQRIRDIPLRIPMSDREQDHSPLGKNRALVELLVSHGFQAQLIPALIDWNALALPASVKKVNAPPVSWHALTCVRLDSGASFLDASWHKHICPPMPLITLHDLERNRPPDAWIEVRDTRQDPLPKHGYGLYEFQMRAHADFFESLNKFFGDND